MADLAAYRDRPHELELRLEGELIRIPILPKLLDRQRSVQRLVQVEIGSDLADIEIIIGLGCSIPGELVALRVSSYNGYGPVPGSRLT